MAIGLFGAFLLTSPASAHTASVKGEAKCESATGTWTVTWTVTNDWTDTATLSNVAVTPAGTTISLPGTISAAPDTSHPVAITGTQTVTGPATEATLTAHVSWPDKVSHDIKGTVALEGPCTKPSESPSASPSAPASASPSQTAVAPVSSSPASGTGAGSTLPVTGTSLTWFVVAAVVLIGGGAALFFVSRRRRTNA